jgi:TRAP-type C4-dicarboxylate transport system substrate-binding protein
MPTSRRRFIRSVGIGGTIALAGCTEGNSDVGGNGNGGSSPAATGNTGNDPLNLVHHSILPDNTVYTEQGFRHFAEKVNEYADREINFEYHFGGELGSAGQATQLLLDGVADTAAVPPAYDSSRYPLSTMAGLPGLYRDPSVAAPAFEQLIDNELGDFELDSVGIEVFAVGVSPTYGLATTDTRVTQPSDAEGLVVRSISPVNTKALNAIGASAEQVPYSEVVQSLNRGTIDGATWQPNQYNTAPGSHEPLSYHVTNVSVTGSVTYFATAPDTWSAFPTDVQEAFTQAGRDLNQSWANGLLQVNEDNREEFGDAVEFYELSDDQLADFDAEFQTVRDNWAENQQGTEEAESVLNAFNEYLSEAQG